MTVYDHFRGNPDSSFIKDKVCGFIMHVEQALALTALIQVIQAWMCCCLVTFFGMGIALQVICVTLPRIACNMPFHSQAYFKTLRTEVWTENISVTIVCPGPVDTDLLRNGVVAPGHKPAVSFFRSPRAHDSILRMC
jgi:hypothetical protein